MVSELADAMAVLRGEKDKRIMWLEVSICELFGREFDVVGMVAHAV